MYISKFSAFNFRSLKQVFVRLENGKNVIVGKNNSGKSNIIKGIEVLIGEKFPTYVNFTDNDYYTYEHIDPETGEIKEIISDNLYLDVELEGRDFNEEIIRTIKKQTAFSKIKSSSELFHRAETGEITVNFDFFQSLDEIENRPETVVLDTFNNGKSKKTEWKKPDELILFLKSLEKIKIFFCKSRIDDEKAGFGLICVDSAKSIWVSHFLSKKLRDSLITTIVISALRSQKEDLRIIHYTWFGKLIMGLWEKNKKNINQDEEKTYEELIKEKSVDIKGLVDTVFHDDTAQIRKLLEGAIAHKTISFRFMNDMNNELYKNIQLFVNDGIDRPLHEKGTGIQSAIIISLFSLYCNNFHNNSSLLIAEEPELFLHPQARRLISAELDKFLKSNDKQPRQLIISTHSIEYLKNVEPYNVVRVYKDIDKNCSVVKQLDSEISKEITIELKRFLWSNNTELFFADKVILVEGGEVYLIPSIVDKLKNSKQLLDYENITVSRVNGKGSFLIYIKMLQCFDIPFLLLGDLDCFKDEVPKLVKYLNILDIKDNTDIIRKALSDLPVNYEAISERVKNVDKNYDTQKLQNLFEQLANKQIDADNEDLQTIVEYMKSRYTKGNKELAIVNAIGQELYDNTHLKLREKNIFIWSKGDLETYYTDKTKRLFGNKSKDIKALELSYFLQIETEQIEDLFLYMEEIALLVEKILIKNNPLPL
ncbi:AAA family ATPase [Arcicella lustrica]|uniref:AAA family ATPase n=1 Tax=Arcicella lustrica TaxID=2984196 RepID=A0ABU5SND9_9BACT|nr:AAA family ATPase [Arcicella sp. DC25W]MEA5428840.1 AAA family ATPase [Arcicella sp. DC25W]